MTTETAVAGTEQQGSAEGRPVTTPRALGWSWPWDLIALVIPLVAGIPWLRLEWLSLQAQPERWFGAAVIGLVLAGSIVLKLFGKRRQDGAESEGSGAAVSRSRGRRAVWLLLLGSACSLLAALWVAPWLGAVGVLGCLVAWALGRFPAVPGSTFGAWAGLLLFVLPLPGRWDTELPAWLEQTAGYLSGSFLDLIGVVNLQFGNSLEVRGLNFSFPLAGRGPLAFWGLAGLVAATLYLRRAPLLPALVSLAFLPLIGLALYFNRFVGLALLQDYWGINALGGVSFIWLCVTCLGVVYLGWLVWDLTLRFLLDAAPPEVPELAPFYAGLNKFLSWPQEPTVELPEEYLQMLPPRAAEPRGDWLRSIWGKAGVFLAVGASLFAAVISLTLIGQRNVATTERGLAAVYTPERLREFPGRETLPETLDQWQRTKFSSPLEKQEEGGGSGERVEYRWRYLSGKNNLEFRLRLPFLGEPDPVAAFRREGWEVTEMRIQRDSEALESAWIELFLRNNSGGRAWVCLSSFDGVGRPYSEQAELARLLPNRPEALDLLKRMLGEVPPLTMQLQLYCDTVDVKNKPELAKLRRIYLQLRQKLLEDRNQRNWSLGL
jgi:hypothetical protein